MGSFHWKRSSVFMRQSLLRLIVHLWKRHSDVGSRSLSVNGDASTNLDIDVSQEVNVFLRLVTRIHRKSNDIRRLARLFLCHPIKIHRFKRLKWHSCRETYCELRTVSRKLPHLQAKFHQQPSLLPTVGYHWNCFKTPCLFLNSCCLFWVISCKFHLVFVQIVQNA